MKKYYPQRGFTLIELMVSITIGLFASLAMAAAYFNSTQTNRLANAVAQMSDDAALALSILRSQIAQTGFSNPASPVVVNADGVIAKNYADRAIFGCDGNFDDLSKAALNELTCAAVAPGVATPPDSLAIAFEADAVNSLANADGEFLDCLGNGITPVAGVSVSYSRFYINNNALFCRGPGNASGQAIIDNVVDMSVRYGVWVVKDAAVPFRVQRYVDASDLPATDDDWARVMTVEICLTLRSENSVLENVSEANPNTYAGCDPFVTINAGTDRRLYRTYSATIVLNNRLGTGV